MIQPRKQIEIALLSGIAAKCALNIQGLQDKGLAQLAFLRLVESVNDLKKALDEAEP